MATTKATFSVQERLSNTPWRTEGVYDTRSMAELAASNLRRVEPVNECGDAIEYRVVSQ